MKRPPIIPPADAHAEGYRRQIVGMMRQIHARVRKDIVPLLRQAVKERDEERRADGLRETWDMIERRIYGLRVAAVASVTREAAGVAGGFVSRVKGYTDRGVMRQVDAVAGFRPRLSDTRLDGQISNLVRLNTDLIVTVPERYFDGLQKAVEQGLSSGMRIETLTGKVDHIYRVSDFNAYRIARDQTSKIQALITQERHRELGVTHYTWRTSADERVRESHAAMNGKRVAYAEPPAETGHYGDDVMCRCSGEPDLSHLTEGIVQSESVDFDGETL